MYVVFDPQFYTTFTMMWDQAHRQFYNKLMYLFLSQIPSDCLNMLNQIRLFETVCLKTQMKYI